MSSLLTDLLALYSPDPTSPERCGFVLAGDVVVEVKNICEDPINGFDVSGRDIMEYEDLAIGTWHTHPDKNSNLTIDDHNSFLSYPQLTHYIVGSDGVSSYAVERGKIISAATHPPSRIAEEHPPRAD